MYPYRKLLWFALPLLGIVILMNSLFPKGAYGEFDTYIIAFEFVQTPGEVNALLNTLTPNQIKGLDSGNYVDFGFMLVYAGLLFFFFYISRQLARRKWLVSGMVLAVFICVFDLVENLQMLGLTEAFRAHAEEGVFLPLLHRLHVFTWLKWGSLALSFALIGFLLLQRGKFSRFIGSLLCIPLLLAAIAIGGNHEWLNQFARSIFLSFGLLLLYCGGYKKDV